jgi:bacterial/archaeal transporter family-2 protein
MQGRGMGSGWIYPFIVIGGVLQALGAPMNGQLKTSLGNPWLASAVSFALVAMVFVGAFAVMPRPLPTVQGVRDMPWWAPVGGLVGAVAVYAGLVLVQKVGAGPYTGLTVTAALVTSLVIDHFGLFNMQVHAINAWRIAGALLMMGGIALIALK